MTYDKGYVANYFVKLPSGQKIYFQDYDNMMVYLSTHDNCEAYDNQDWEDPMR